MRILLVFDRTQFSENGRFQTQNSPKMGRSFAFQPHIDPSRSTWGVLECASVSRRAREVGQSVRGGIVTSALNLSLLVVATYEEASHNKQQEARGARRQQADLRSDVFPSF